MVADFPKLNATNRIRTGKSRFNRLKSVSAVIKQVQKERSANPKYFIFFVYKLSLASIQLFSYSSPLNHLKEELMCNAVSLVWLNVSGEYHSAQAPPLKS
jgi:hypothetical protein